MEDEKKIQEQQERDEQLINAITQLGYSEATRLNDFITLSQQLKAKQEAIDVMAADSTPSAIGSSYVSDTLEPNSQGDLITLVAKTPGEQPILDDIYNRLNLPLDKIVYSLFKNAIAIGEFAHEGDLVDQVKNLKSKPAVESVEKPATEEIMVKVHNSKLAPKIKLLSDTTRVFPILQYETVIGFIEVVASDLSNFDLLNDTLTYKDVVIHSAQDYAYVKFGYRTESNPLVLRVKMPDDSVVEYEIDQGRSLLEAAYPAWQTLSIMKDSVNLARLAFSASSVVVQTEVGNMTEAQIEVARNKLKDLFENRLALGKNGMKSYLQPQIKPNYIYSFTTGGVGAITVNTVGGDYNPGVLTDLKYFEDEFFGAMGAVKQHYARTEDGGGLDGGGAVEQYEKRWKSGVAQFKRLLGKFIKECINRVLISRELIGMVNNYEVIVNKAYEEDDLSVVNHQQTKLSFIEAAINFLEIEDAKKLKELRLQALKTIITDKTLIEAISNVVLEEGNPTSEGGDTGDGAEDDMDEFGGDIGGGGGGGDPMDTISDIGTEEDSLGEEGGEDLGEEGEGEGDELPAVSDLVDEGQIDSDTE